MQFFQNASRIGPFGGFSGSAEAVVPAIPLEPAAFASPASSPISGCA